MNKTRTKVARAQNAATSAARHTAKDLIAQTQPASRVVTPDSTRATSDWNTAMSAWKTLPASVQNQWLGLARQVNQSERAGRQTLNASAMYQRVCAVRLKCGMGLPDAVPLFAPPGGLPPVTLDAVFAVPGNALRLTLRSEAVAGTIQCFACDTVLPDQPVRHASEWVCLGTLPGLQTGTDISALYAKKMPPPVPGYKVCVRLVPVAETGLRGGPLLVTAVVPE